MILNGLGGTKYEELFVLWNSVASLLQRRGLTVVSPLVGEYVTSLDMKGCSLTLTWLDDELEQLWLSPCCCASLRIGDIGPSVLAPRTQEKPKERITWEKGSPESKEAARTIAEGFACVAQALSTAEIELGRIDAQAGDGDHGLGMARGSAAAAETAKVAADAGAGAASVLAAGADAWADRAGGASGALWGLGLRSASAAFSDDCAVEPEQVAAAVSKALQAVIAVGGAKPGDKTLIDSLAPFAETLTAAIHRGIPLREAWKQAAEAAEKGAEDTRNLTPRIGRARPLAERSKGHRDAGAVSLALAARTVLQVIGGSK